MIRDDLRPGVQSEPLVGRRAPAYLWAMTRIARLEGRSLVRVSGADARPFLHNLLTQDVETLADGELRFGALLSPPGRLLFELFILGQGEDILLDVAQDRRDDLIQKLTLYRLRAKVEITADDQAVLACWPDLAPGFLIDPRTPQLGGRAYGVEAEANADQAGYRAHALSLGVADMTIDATIDRTYPIEANFDLLNGIDFNKGCFVGQETTSRMKRRGAIKNRILPLHLEGPRPEPGAEVLNGDRRAGEVVASDAGVVALMRLDRADGQLTVGEASATVARPDWMPDWPRPEPS
jgi:folate-binding protein YgfZ